MEAVASNTNVRMDIEGWEFVQEDLREVMGPHYIGAARRALAAAAEPIKQKAIEDAPEKTGRLGGAIVTSRIKTVGKGRGGNGYAYIKIGILHGSGAAYGIPVEFGHVNQDGSFTAPRPFMRPAYESQKAAAYAILREELAREIDSWGW